MHFPRSHLLREQPQRAATSEMQRQSPSLSLLHLGHLLLHLGANTGHLTPAIPTFLPQIPIPVHGPGPPAHTDKGEMGSFIHNILLFMGACNGIIYGAPVQAQSQSWLHQDLWQSPRGAASPHPFSGLFTPQKREKKPL